MSIASLAKHSGEQHKTIRSIEAGKVCSLHHAVWMKNILGIDLNEIISETWRGDTYGQEGKVVSGIDDLI